MPDNLNPNPTNPPVPLIPGATNQPPAATAEPATWDAYLESLPANLKALYEGHTTSLRNAVQATRQERDALSQQLAGITKALGKDPVEAKRLIETMAADLESARMRADFFEAAGKPEIGCSNPRMAMLMAQEIGAMDSKGRINWDAVKQAAPELFQKRAPDGRAGIGTGSPPVTKIDMNTLLRRAAGRQS